VGTPIERRFKVSKWRKLSKRLRAELCELEEVVMADLTRLAASVAAVGVTADTAVAKIDELKAIISSDTDQTAIDAAADALDATKAKLDAAVAAT